MIPINDPFIKFDSRTSAWTPPDGQFSALDHYIDHCCRSIVETIVKLIVISSLPQEEKQLALQDLRLSSSVYVYYQRTGIAISQYQIEN